MNRPQASSQLPLELASDRPSSNPHSPRPHRSATWVCRLPPLLSIRHSSSLRRPCFAVPESVLAEEVVQQRRSLQTSLALMSSFSGTEQFTNGGRRKCHYMDSPLFYAALRYVPSLSS